MIINGGGRGGALDLATHLLRTDTNEKVEVMEIMHGSSDLHEVLLDFEVMVNLTKGSIGLYHANIDPDEKYDMTDDQWWRSVDLLEQEMKFEGLPRVVIKHTKKGRSHVHVVWQRTDTDTMTLRDYDWNYIKHEKVSRQLEKEFGHERVQGKHIGDAKARSEVYERSDMTVSFAEYQKMEREGRTLKDYQAQKKQVTELFNESENGKAFEAALEEAGFILAQGDKRAFLVVDVAGIHHNLTRMIIGTLAKEVYAHIDDLERPILATLTDAIKMQEQSFEAYKREQQDRQSIETELGAPKIAQDLIDNNPALKEIDERYQQDMHELIEYQKSNLTTMEGQWKDEIERKVEGYKKRLNKKSDYELWQDWGVTKGQMKHQNALIKWSEKTQIKRRELYPQPQLKPKPPIFARYRFNLVRAQKKNYFSPWIKAVEYQNKTENEKIKDMLRLKDVRHGFSAGQDTAKTKKEARAKRAERHRDLLHSYIDELYQQREADRDDFARELAEQRLNLEAHRQRDLRNELKHEAEFETAKEKAKREHEQNKQIDKAKHHGRGRDPDERER